MLEFQSRVLKVKFDGADHDIRFPNVKELRNLARDKHLPTNRNKEPLIQSLLNV